MATYLHRLKHRIKVSEILGLQRYLNHAAILPSNHPKFDHTQSKRPNLCMKLFPHQLNHIPKLEFKTMGSLPAIPEPLSYPVARRDESVVDNYHGVLIPDPYRWLEDPESEEVKDFVQKQVKLTDEVLATCDLRSKLREKITAAYDHPRYGLPLRRRDKYFYLHNSGLQAQNILYTQDCLDEGEPEVLLDPNALSEDGTVSLSRYAISQDAEYLAYGLSSSGSDWVTIKVMRIADRTVLADTLSWVKFSSIAWTHDNKGFFYSRFPAPRDCSDGEAETSSNLYHELCYHFLGTDQSQDILCWKDPSNPKHRFLAEITDDGKFVIVCVEEGCDPANKLYYLDISAHPLQRLDTTAISTTQLLPFVKFIDTFDARYHLVANDETIFTFLTNKDAPRYKVVRVDVKKPDVWTDVVPEADQDVLEFVRAAASNRMILSYLSDVKSVLQVRDLRSGALIHCLKMDDVGSVFGISARREDDAVYVSFSSFLTPGIVYQCDLSEEVPELRVLRESLVRGFDRSDFNAQQVFVTSKDGTRIPIFIVAKKNISLDRSHPCLLYGYGGFDYKLSPYFKASNIVLMRHLDAVFCMANIRGGGEYGTEWHKGGSLANKQNCFNDFIAAAEYLVSAGYTQPRKLCIEGASNGGLLVAACVNQRPELFGCALAHVGVMDMLRFHKFTIGHAWTTEYGCSDNEEEFKWLVKYSPLHNVRRPWERSSHLPLQYPATMLLTADHDNRVVPLHSLKMLATMQHVLCTSLKHSPQTKPIIARIETNAGHGAGRSTQKMINEDTDSYSFMAKMLDAVWID